MRGGACPPLPPLRSWGGLRWLRAPGASSGDGVGSPLSHPPSSSSSSSFPKTLSPTQLAPLLTGKVPIRHETSHFPLALLKQVLPGGTQGTQRQKSPRVTALASLLRPPQPRSLRAALPKKHLTNIISFCQKQNVLSRCAFCVNYIFLICSGRQLLFKMEHVKLDLQKS